MRLRIGVCAACLVGSLATGLAAAADAVSRVPVEPFFRHADYSSFKLSPSGKYVAGLIPLNGRNALVAIELATRKPGPPTTLRGNDIASFDWVNDERLVFTNVDRQVGGGAQRGFGLYTVKPDGTGFNVLTTDWRTQILATLDDGSDAIIVAAYEPNPRYPDVYRMDAQTGQKRLLTLGKPADMVYWVVDRKGIPRAGIAQEAGGETGVYWRASDNAKWEKLGHYKLRDARTTPVDFDGDGSLIVASGIGRDKLALFRYDPQKRMLGELIAEHPQADIGGGLVFDPQKGRVVGVTYDADRTDQAWFDDDWARVAAAVARALPNRSNTITRSVHGRLALVRSTSDTDPGAYYLLDLDQRRMEKLVDVRRDINPEAMPTRKAVRYQARDGLEIPAILTLPRGKPAKDLPLVLYVHGGPWVRGANWEWRDEPAFLGSLGYAVLEPEFRGSTGLGGKHFVSSFKQWGRAMQDDLDDGVDWLAAQGIIDPKRACIMGASYGGYAVMMGLARNPERWKCGINYVGVTDISLMYDVAWSDSAYSTFMQYNAKEMIGDPEKDGAQLKATSPIEQADRIKAPVLMAYGGRDRRVPLIHGQKMRDALQSRNAPVEWIVYGEEGHGFLVEATRFDFYRRVAAFLDKHLPP